MSGLFLLYGAGSELGQSWCVPPLESCCPAPGPGLLVHVATVDAGTGASAFGIGSGSVNGLRMSGLVGYASSAGSSVHTLEPATWAAAFVGRPAMAPTAVAAPVTAPIFRMSLLL